MKKAWLLAVLAVAPLSWTLHGCGSSKGPPNVVLIVMDTVRADHMSCLGYGRPTTPNIDAFVERATLYERAIASAPWSIPSHASMFSGKDPFQHGGHRSKSSRLTGKREKEPSGRDGKQVSVHNSPPGLYHKMLAQMFQGEGYFTGAVVANDGYLSPRWGMHRGFKKYSAELAHGDVVNERVMEMLDGVAPDTPFFLFVNYMDAHKPYNTTPRAGITDDPVEQEADLALVLMRRVQDGVKGFPPDLLRRAIDQYDTGIANVDLHVGSLLREFEARGLLDNTIIVLTSDHGEAFGEHRFVLHGNDVYEEEVWVPLIVRAPGQSTAKRVSLPVSGSDIPRLIFEHLPPEMLTKHVLDFPNAPGNHPVISQNYFSYKQMNVSQQEFDRIRTAIYDWPYKLIHSSDGKSELYHLENDPGEKHNLIDEEPDLVQALSLMWEEFQGRRQEAQQILSAPTLTDEEIEKLKTLGYIGN